MRPHCSRLVPLLIRGKTYFGKARNSKICSSVIEKEGRPENGTACLTIACQKSISSALRKQPRIGSLLRFAGITAHFRGAGVTAHFHGACIAAHFAAAVTSGGSRGRRSCVSNAVGTVYRVGRVFHALLAAGRVVASHQSGCNSQNSEELFHV